MQESLYDFYTPRPGDAHPTFPTYIRGQKQVTANRQSSQGQVQDPLCSSKADFQHTEAEQL